MDVLKITEQPDGSALVDVEMSEEEQGMLLSYAVTNLLKEHIERIEHEDNIRTTISDTE